MGGTPSLSFEKGFSLGPADSAELLAKSPSTAAVLKEQMRRWSEVFPEESWDFSIILASPKLPGYDWPVLIPGNTSNNKLFALCSNRFGATYSPYGRDADLDRFGPNQHSATLRWFRKSQEPDLDLLGLNDVDLYFKKIFRTVNFLERLWMGVDWYTEYGNELDQRYQTLAAGSHLLGGGVSLRFHGVCNVGVYRTDERNPDWGVRSYG